MKRTRKWNYVAQEATRLANLGLAPPEIARRLEVRPSTVQRWMKDGKLADTRRSATGRPGIVAGRSSEEWGKAVRSDYALDATDEELVQIAEKMLAAAHDPRRSFNEQVSASKEFRAIVKQVNLVSRPAAEPEPKPEPTKQVERPAPTRTEDDPRRFLLQVVNQ